MKSSTLQSLSRRIKASIAEVHEEIAFYADKLVKINLPDGASLPAFIAEHNRVVYSKLSKLQRERKKLEALQAELKENLKHQTLVEQAARVLNRHGLKGDVILLAEGAIKQFDGV